MLPKVMSVLVIVWSGVAVAEDAGGVSGLGGACCFSSVPGNCAPALDEADCQNQGGIYQGDMTQCSDPFIYCSGFCPTPQCDFCWHGQPQEGNCPTNWCGDGQCDCGCQFQDVDCPWPSTCSAGGDDCCTPSTGPGCNDPLIESCVCGIEPSCCDTLWDPYCVDIAQFQCGTCCGDPCAPACGGDPCDPACSPDPCDPRCFPGVECDPVCFPGVECDPGCNPNWFCEPTCGGDPCRPECGGDCGGCCLPPVDTGCGTTYPDPSCVYTSSGNCDTLGGLYLGSGVPCETTTLVVDHNGPPSQWSHSITTESNCPEPDPGGGDPTCPEITTCTDEPGYVDAWQTNDEGGMNCEDFGHTDSCPIPGGFFGPGSDPFFGEVCFHGDPVGTVAIPGFSQPYDFGNADTVVLRSEDPFDRCELPSPTPATVDIQLVALSLASCDPIVVTSNGMPESMWDVRVELDPNTAQPGGTLTATKSHCNGGTFDSIFAVCPRFTFTNVADPMDERTLDFCPQCDPGGIQLTASGVSWAHEAGVNACVNNPVCSGFVAGVDETDPETSCDCNMNGRVDECDIDAGTSGDCNANGTPDECDIASGTSSDITGDGVPDECGATGGCCLPTTTTSCGEQHPDPGCVVETELECAADGGLFLGDGAPCETLVRKVNHEGPPSEWSHTIEAVSNCPEPDMGGGGDPTCPPQPPCQDEPAMIDPWVTESDAGANCENFSTATGCPIPADFFGPGSLPFEGEVCFNGAPIGPITLPGFSGPLDFGDADTLVRRLGDPFDRCEAPSPTESTVDIELVALSLTSCAPITVQYSPGAPIDFDVRVELDPGAVQPGGTLTATKTHCNGGTFDSSLAVCPRFLFTEVGNPSNEYTLEYCAMCDPSGIPMTATDVPWVHDAGDNTCLVNPVCSDFVAGVEDTDPHTDCDCNNNGFDDDCDIAAGTSADCNTNGKPDECDIAGGTSGDVNMDGVPDECGATGACCLPTIPTPCGNQVPEPSCVITTEAACGGLGGDYLGDNVPCDHIVRVVNHNGPPDQWSHSISVVSNCPPMDGGGGSGPDPDCMPAPACTTGPYHIDDWSTAAESGTNCEDFGHGECPIPAGFFGPGSDPFLGEVCFHGAPLGSVLLPGFSTPLDFGDADTLVRRDSDPFSVCDLPGPTPSVVPIELVALSLVSCDPIMVTSSGTPDTMWDVRVTLDPVTPQPGGTLTATKTHCNGGTFDSVLAVCPRFVFNEVGNPTNELTLDYCVDCSSDGIQMTASGVSWVHDVAENMCLSNPVCSDFRAGIAESDPEFECDCNSNGIHDRCDAADGDVNGDGVSDLTDWEIASQCVDLCMDGQCAPPRFDNPCCHLADFDHDGDLDLKDFGGLQEHRSPAP